jgi:hypothetical protein
VRLKEREGVANYDRDCSEMLLGRKRSRRR